MEIMPSGSCAWMLGVGRPSKGTVFGAMRKIQGRSCQTFVDFFFRSLPGNCHRRRESRRLMTASRSVSRPPQLALGEMRPFLLPQQAQIAPLTPPSRTLSIPVCEFLFWTSCGRGPPSILQAANEKRGRLSRQKACCCCWLSLSLVMRNVISSSGSETAAAAVLGGFLLGTALFPSHRTGTGQQSRTPKTVIHHIPLPSPPPSPPPSRVCAKSVGDRTDTRTRARTREENGLALSTARRTGEVWRCSNVPTRS